MRGSSSLSLQLGCFALLSMAPTVGQACEAPVPVPDTPKPKPPKDTQKILFKIKEDPSVDEALLD
eukprot:2454375-Amphidinium_carterae.2